MKKVLPGLFSVLFLAVGCNVINPSEQVPTYVHIEPFIYTNPDSLATGASTHDIPSAWLYCDGQAVGTFDLPCTVPVIMKKTSLLTITPAVTNQGLKAYVLQYPYYQSDTATLVYAPGATPQTVQPRTRYYSAMTAADFPLMENFDDGLAFASFSGDTAIIRTTAPGEVLQGTASGKIWVDQNHKQSISISTKYFPLPSNQCFMELDYKSTVPFQVGLQAFDEAGTGTYGQYIAGFNPRSEWTKIYINLTSFTGQYNYFARYYIVLRSSLNDFSQYKEGYVLLDNIKVIAR